MHVYLDNAASTKVSRAAREAALEVIDTDMGNPSSGHYMGRLASDKLRKARRQAAALLSAPENDVIFTSGGTESNCLAIFGAVKRAGSAAITGKSEHPSIIKTFGELEARGVEARYLQPRENGTIDPAQLQAAITERTVLVSLMHVNHETGVISDIEGFSRVIRDACKHFGKDILFHVDAVQGFGKIPFDVRKWNADLVSISAHKIHGMSGTGALYVRGGVLGKLRPVFYGGGQERALRPGTENLAGICAFGAACEEAGSTMSESLLRVTAVKERLLQIPREIGGAVINGENTSPYITNISFLGTNAEVMQNALDSRGIYISAGAACSMSKKSPENAVFSYGLGIARAESSIRISLCRHSTLEDAERLISAIKDFRGKNG